MKQDFSAKVSRSSMRDGILHVDGTLQDKKEVYDIFRISVLDGLIPIKKVIGFKIISYDNVSNVGAVERHSSCLENMIQLSTNASKLIFVPRIPIGDFINTGIQTGVITSANAKFKNNTREVPVLDKKVYLYHANSDMGLRLYINENIGLHLMEENVDIMKQGWGESKESSKSLLGIDNASENSSMYFPLNTEHSLIEYLSVLPFRDGEIRYKIRQGVSESDIEFLWHNYVNGGVQ